MATETLLATDRLAGPAKVFKLLSDPARLVILCHLQDGQASVGRLAKAAQQSQPLTSHNLLLLRRAGLLDMVREGKNNFYFLTPAGESVLASVSGILDNQAS